MTELATDVAIELCGVSKKYRYFTLDNIHLKLPRGQILGLIGANGAGKSTTIRIVMGLVHQDSGEARVLGHSMPAEQVAAKWDIGFASEDMRLYDSMTLGWHMNFVRSIYPHWDAAYAQLLVKRFGLQAEQKIKGLSHGQRVKSALLLVLAQAQTAGVRRAHHRSRSGGPPRDSARVHPRDGQRGSQRPVLVAQHPGCGTDFRSNHIH